MYNIYSNIFIIFSFFQAVMEMWSYIYILNAFLLWILLDIYMFSVKLFLFLKKYKSYKFSLVLYFFLYCKKLKDYSFNNKY